MFFLVWLEAKSITYINIAYRNKLILNYSLSSFVKCLGIITNY